MAAGSNSNLLDLDILLRLPTNARNFARDLEAQLSTSLANGVSQATKDALKAQQAAAERFYANVSRSSTRAIKQGLGTKEVEEIRDRYRSMMEERMKATAKLADVEEKLQGTLTSEKRKELEMEKEALLAFGKLRDAQGKKELANLKRLEIQQSSLVMTSSKITEKAFKGGITSAFNGIKDGDLEGLTTGFTKALSSALVAASAKASVVSDDAAAAGDTGKASQMQGIASALAGLAKFAMVATAVVGALAAIMAIVAMVDSKFKDMNENILRGRGAFDLLGKEGDNLTESLDGIRQVTTDFGRALRLGATADELNDMVGAMAAFGTNMVDVNDTDTLARDIEGIGRYARLTGEAFDSMTTSFAEYADRMGTSLGDVVDGFNGVLSAARDSGFGVNRFQAAVFEATANTALYNKRLDETAGLMNLLSKSVGLEEAQQMVQDAGSYYQNRSLGERFVDVSTTDRGAVTEIIENEISGMLSSMGGDMRSSMDAQLRAALTAAGLSSDGTLEELLERTRTADNRSQILGGLDRGEASQADIALQMMDALGGSNEDRARVLPLLSNSGSFAMRYMGGRSLIGNTDYNDMSMGQELYVEQQMGMSPQEIRRMRLVEQDFQSEMAALQRAATTGEGRSAFEDAGYSFDGGRIMSGDREINSIVDYIQANSDRFDAMMEEDEMTSLTRQVVDNTLKFEDIIQAGVTSFLSQLVPVVRMISDNVAAIMRFMFGQDETAAGVQESDITAAREALAANAEAEIKNIQDLEAAQANLSNIYGDFIPAGVSENLSGEISASQARLESAQSGLSGINAIRTEGEMRAFLAQYLPSTLTSVEDARVQSETVVSTDNSYRAWRNRQEEMGVIAPSGLNSDTQAFIEWATGDSTAVAGPIQETAEDAAAQTRLQQDSLAIQEDQETTLQRMLNTMRDAQMMSLLTGSGVSALDAPGIIRGMASGLSANDLGISDQLYQALQAQIGTPVNDFIFQSVGAGARITPIHSQDQFLGLKPNGPIDAAMSGKGGQSVVININGGNTAEIVRTVNQVLDRKGIFASRPHRGK